MSGLWNFEYINIDELSYSQPDLPSLWVAEDEILILPFLNLTLIYFLLFQHGQQDLVSWLVQNTSDRDRLASTNGERCLLHYAAKYGQVRDS